MSISRHVRSLSHGEVVHDSALGSVRRLTADEFPLLQRLSIKRLQLQPGALREPHWHANADELGYVIEGELLLTVVDNADGVSSFTAGPGQMFHFESGSLHAIENIGDTPAEVIIAFSHERPEDFSMRAAFAAMSDGVLGNTYDLPAQAFAGRQRDTGEAYLLRRPAPAPVQGGTRFADPHRFDIEAQSPPVDFPYGQARVSRRQFWPALKHLSMYSLRIPDSGMREPHWHPDTAEMGYVHRGRARMTILDPDGATDTYELQAGDVYFIPRAYPHQIEVLGEDIHFLVFFDQPTPGDIGYRLSGSAFDAPVLAATLGMPVEAMPVLPFTANDPLIVARRNPA
ncbi:cupin [Stenotrophomonas panacihumi]|uniref:Cupin n=1 Tax=Stenotrophomonas panacihumi TaxID=676599 RepID=A0A0R0ASU3_9GAMM|nr:cupin domain-containing protein [Stenotrophomonas panacihumi]KRG43235.1 cupin [Stenotrophomonas panacihumi]PTN55712.1 cupin domain-containing protein [Stenotrophomonas panacihumi]